MTTFAGNTIPPIFGGAKDPIFIRSVAPAYFVDGDGAIPANDLDKPTLKVNDLLVVFAYQASGNMLPNIATSANWTTILSLPGGAVDILSNRASGNATDDYSTDSRAAGGVGHPAYVQMISLASGVTGKRVVHIQNGPTNTAVNTDFDIFAMTVGPDINNTFVMGVHGRFDFNLTAFANPEVDDISGMNQIAKQTTRIIRTAFPTQFLYSWIGWAGIYQAVSSAVPLQNLPYIPNLAADNRNSYLRFGLINI